MEKMRYDFHEFKNELLNGGMRSEDRQVVRLEKRIEDLKRRIIPWRERAILTGDDEARRRDITGD